jgi:hypothetical protein
MASELKPLRFLPCSGAKRLRKWEANMGMSLRRFRSGGAGEE